MFIVKYTPEIVIKYLKFLKVKHIANITYLDLIKIN